MTGGATASSADGGVDSHLGPPDCTAVYAAGPDELVTAIERARHRRADEGLVADGYETSAPLKPLDTSPRR